MEGNFWTGWFNDNIPDIAQGRLYELPPRLQFDDVPLLTAGPPQPLKGGQNQLGTDQALEPSFGFISVPTGNGGRAQQIHAD